MFSKSSVPNALFLHASKLRGAEELRSRSGRPARILCAGAHAAKVKVKGSKKSDVSAVIRRRRPNPSASPLLLYRSLTGRPPVGGHMSKGPTASPERDAVTAVKIFCSSGWKGVGRHTQGLDWNKLSRGLRL